MVTFMTNMMPSVVLRQRLPAPHWAGGFDRLIKTGAEVTRRKVRGFFYALQFMMDGVLGSCKARWDLSPVCQPDTSSIAQILTALSGGLKPFDRSFK